MSIIQTIRDKGAAIVIGVIALSLIGFLLMDASPGQGGLFGGSQSKTIGEVNGQDIEIDEFNTKVREASAQYPSTEGGLRQQIMQGVWDQMVAERVIETEFDELGLEFTPKEMSATMFSDDAPQDLKQAFTDPQTGQYDIARAQQWWNDTRKKKNDTIRQALNSQIIEPMRLNSLYTKYTSMITAAAMYIPSWMITKENEDDNSFANISYTAIPYTVISDSAVKVTDDDIENYLEKNKKKYQQEAGLMISYVSFSGLASARDSAEARNQVESLIPQFVTDTNANAFLARNSSALNFFDGYALKSQMAMPNKDSIINLPEGKVFGPYLDGGNYVVAKKISTKTLPDSIKNRHILLGTVNLQSGAVIMADSVAKQKADSIATAIKAGADFNALQQKYSTDEEAKKTQGVMTFDLNTIQNENFAKEYRDFLLNEKGETKKVVKTQFGWHYIEIMEKKNPQPAYQVAYMAKAILPSEETINGANAAATKLSGMARDSKAFDEYVKKNNLEKVNVPAVIKENDASLGGLQDARDVIKWAFDAEEGEVSGPISVGSQYIVAVVTNKVDKGLPDAKIARPLVEQLIRNRKKAELIIKKVGKNATMEAAAAAYGRQVLTTGSDSTLTFNAAIINGIGSEPKVAGASFNKDYQTKVSPAIEGMAGVFFIKVNSIQAKPAQDPAIAQQVRNMKFTQAMQAALGKSFEALKKMADVKDKRSKFF